MHKFTEKHIIVGSLLLSYYESPGPKNAVTLVFLHGWGSSSALWMHVFGKFAPAYRMVFLDLPGFGKSQMPKDVWGVDEYASCVERFLDKLDVKQYVIVGHSFGGSLGIVCAVRHPQVKALVLIGSAGVRSYTRKKSAITSIAGVVRPLFAPPFMQPLRKAIYKRLGSDYLDNPPHLQRIYGKVVYEDLTPLLGKVQQPVLLVWGDHDTETPLSDGKLMREKLPHAMLNVIPGAGHFSFTDNPDAVAKNMEEFLNEKL
jgi:pimeloyl-ACP methyl ester carboxylesterase